MLALTRKNGESLRLFPSENLDPTMTVKELFKGGAVDIVITEINRSSVKVLIDAPGEICIVRHELL